MSETFATRIVRGGTLTFSAITISRLVSFVSMIFLVRTLLPEDFGFAAMALTALASINLLTGFGTTHAIVQSSAKPHDLGIAALIISWTSGIPLFLLFVVYAEQISLLYGTDQLRPLLTSLSPLILVHALAGVPYAFLQKNMRYGKRAVVLVCQELAHACVSVIAAATGHGLWSLIYGKIARDLTLLLVPWALSQPKEWFRGALPPWTVIKEVWFFGAQTVTFSLLVFFNTAWYSLLLGRGLGPAALGYYDRAWVFATMPLEQFGQPLAGVLFPAYAKLQNEPDRLRRGYLRSIQIFSLIIFPVLTGLYAVSHEFVCTVMGAAWVTVIPILQVLSIMGLFRVFPMTLSPLYLGMGVPRYNVGISAIDAVSTVLFTLPTVRYGLLGVVLAGSLARVLSTLYALKALSKVLPGILPEVGRAIAAPAAACGVMVAGIWAIRPVVHTVFSSVCGVGTLASLVLLGVCLYVGSVILLDRKIITLGWEIWTSFRSSSLRN